MIHGKYGRQKSEIKNKMAPNTNTINKFCIFNFRWLCFFLLNFSQFFIFFFIKKFFDFNLNNFFFFSAFIELLTFVYAIRGIVYHI